jgi:hypothetical protein
MLFSHPMAQSSQLFGEDNITPGLPLTGDGTRENQGIPVIDGTPFPYAPVDKFQVKIKSEGNPGNIAIGLCGQVVMKPVIGERMIGRSPQSLAVISGN